MITPSRALFWFCIAFIVGVSLQNFIKIPQVLLGVFLIIGIVAIFVYSWISHLPKTIFIVGIFSILFLVLGILRLQVAQFNAENDKLRKFNDTSENIILTGQIIAEPDFRSNFQKIKIKTGDSIVLITAGNYPEYKYLDELKITGQLKTPPEIEGFNYKNYLLKDGVYSVMDFPKIELTSKKHNYNPISFLYEKILFLKGKLMKSIDESFKKPDSEILKGVIFGNDKNIPKDLKDKFNTTGLSHITAVSGSNIVILTTILMSLLLFLGLWRNQAFYFSIILIWLYIFLIGLPASGVRAAIMGSIFLSSEFFGRQNTSSRTIVIAGAIMLLQNPFLLIYDIGFQLSFLASMGIIHIKPIFDSFLLPLSKFGKESKSKVREATSKVIRFLLDIVSVTISAQIFVLPIIIYNFSNISLVSPITNLLVLPVVPFLMISGLLSSVFGIFSGFFGWVFSLPCDAMIYYLLKVLDALSQPWAIKSFENISLIWFLPYYLILTTLIFYLNKKIKPKFLGY